MIQPDPIVLLRHLVTERLGLVASPAHDHRLNAALDQLAKMTAAPAPSAALAELAAQSEDSPAWQLVIDAVVIGETHFFRQAGWFAQLEAQVLRPLVERRRGDGTKRLRIWSAACATGEEAYTLALIVKRLVGDVRGWDIGITGTDLNERSIAQAKRAVFREWVLREVDPVMRAQFFRDAGRGAFELAAPVREMVSFRRRNLIAAPALIDDLELRDVDLVVCRNMLMYLVPEQQLAVAQRLIGSLANDGWLAVAPAEANAEWFRPLVPFNVPSAIFFRHDGPVRARRPIVPPAAVTKDVPGDAERVRELIDRGEAVEARAQCEALLVRDGLDFSANLLMALICDELDDVAGALTAAGHAAYLEPRSAHAHFLCGSALVRSGRMSEARRKIAAALELLDADPAAPACWDVPADRLRVVARDLLAGASAATVRMSLKVVV